MTERVRRIVQFRRPLTRDERQRLQREYGLALTDYTPDNAYVESLPAGSELEREPLVRAVTAVGADRRCAPEGKRRRARAWYEAVLFPDADVPAVVAALRERGAAEPSVIDDRAHGSTVKIRFFLDGPVAGLAEVDDVRWLDEVGEAKLDTSSPVTAAPLARAWAAPLWQLGLSGAGQVIGVIDSPIDLGHRFFADPAQPVGPAHRKVVGFRNAESEPPARHGTFVAGIAAGDDPTQPGAHPDRGAAWGARLAYGNNDDIRHTGVLAYLAAAAAEGARVHTNSWHDEPVIQYNQLAADLDTFAWNNEEHLIVGSAGNRGEQLGPPGTAKNVLAVAASRGPAPAPFGDGATGPASDGRHKPEVMAPGCAIRSTAAGTQAGVELIDNCASSWAAPAVAGLAALVRQYYVDRQLMPSGALLRATLIAGCLPDGAGPYPSDTGGWGVVRVDETLRGPLLIRDVRHAAGLATGESATHEIEVRGAARPLAVTLVWTDPPGLAGSGAPAVNALELTVVPPDGGPPLRGNVFAGGFSTPGPAPERPDPVQRILIREPAAGRWTVHIDATAVHVGHPGQGYALVVQGDLGPT